MHHPARAHHLHPNLHPSDPDHSFWIRASAGTGKTKTLIDRLLRLLIRGVDPFRIVCITYTKAAAHEIHERLMHQLYQLSQTPLDQIRDVVQLLGESVHDGAHAKVIQALYTYVNDRPLTVQTIHSFCQKILMQCPFEAGIDIDTTLMDEDDSLNLKDFAIQLTLNDASHDDADIQCILTTMSEGYLKTCLHDALQNRGRIDLKNADVLRKNALKMDSTWIYPLTLFQEDMRYLCTCIAEKGIKSLKPMAMHVLQTIHHTQAAFYSACMDLCFTQTGARRAQIISKSIREEHPDMMDIVERCMNHLEGVYASWMHEPMMRVNYAFDQLFEKTLTRYSILKSMRHVMDFDDIIEKTYNLLQSHQAWVLEKLEGGFDHIIVDEAQDTSPRQWHILSELLTHFFDRPAYTRLPYSPSMPRTLCVVGDVKQSIYSFQGAQPELYQHMHDQITQHMHHAGFTLHDAQLDTCYRCAPEVLAYVDHVCAHPDVKAGLLTPQDIHHHAARPVYVRREGINKPDFCDQQGAHFPVGVDSAPLYESQDENDTEEAYAHHLCDKITGWIQSKIHLPATGAPVTYADILIVMQRRGTLMSTLSRVMTQRSIPHIAHDRGGFLQHLAVRDMLVFLQCLDCPMDDLNLASFLKNPIVNVSDHDVQELCLNRGDQTLFESISTHENLSHAVHWLMPQGDMYQHIYAYMQHYIQHAQPYFADDLQSLCTALLLLLDDAYTRLKGDLAPRALYEWMMRYGAHTSLSKVLHKGEHHGVNMMTVHGAKGLQAPIVMIVDSGDDMTALNSPILYTDDFHILRSIPNTQGQVFSDQSVLTKNFDFKDQSYLSKIKYNYKHKEYLESMRLFYVAITRAQDYVWIGGIHKRKCHNWHMYTHTSNKGET